MNFKEMLGDKPATCGHQQTGNAIMILSAKEEGEREDFEFLRDHLQLDKDITSIRLCWTCHDLLPSAIAKKRASQEAQAKREQEAKEQLDAKIEEARESGQQLFKCPGCDELWFEEELVQIRHCPHCDIDFNGTDNGRNCSDCNRPFTSLLTERGCPDCESEDECEEINLDELKGN